MKGKSFVSQRVQLTEYEENTQVRLVPSSRVFRGGHRFKFTAVGDKTKVDHEVEMDPKGIWKLIPPLVSTEVKATPSPPGTRAEQTLTSTSRRWRPRPDSNRRSLA